MLPHIIEGRYVSGHTVWLRFSDGAEGEVNLSNELHGPVFEPLRNVEVFRQFVVHPELRTLVWPNGADFDPATLHNWPNLADEVSAAVEQWRHETVNDQGGPANGSQPFRSE